VGEEDFDLILGRLRADGRQWWADPSRRRPLEINHQDDGRGLYWEGPDGHWLEIITRPYGSGS
jgi:catechol 2,3-dioxygenase-like lactoylglutathione lyase family enzyme